jgi:hypothetical protein
VDAGLIGLFQVYCGSILSKFTFLILRKLLKWRAIARWFFL